MAIRATKPDQDAPQPRRVRASALPPGLESPLGVRAFCPARVFTPVRLWLRPLRLTLSRRSVGLRERGIDESQATDLRHGLLPFAEDWDRPEMAAYDELPPR